MKQLQELIKLMMEILQVVANKLKSDFSKKIKDNLTDQNYGLKSCTGKSTKDFNNIKLELIFITNLCYIPLNDSHLRKIKSGNYTNLFARKAYSGALADIVLGDTVIVNNTTIINNTIIESDNGNDVWLTTEF